MFEWHKLPEDPPKKKGRYLVTIHVEGFPRKVIEKDFDPRYGFFWYPGCDDELKAWDELPDPYQED